MKRKVSIILLVALIIGIIPSNNVSAAQKISISKKSMSLTVGKSKKLNLKNAKKNKVKWSSSKKSVATVSKTGKVTARKKGTAKITAKYLGKKYSCKVVVKSKSAGASTVGEKKNTPSVVSTTPPIAVPTSTSTAKPTAKPTVQPTEEPTSIRYMCNEQVVYDSINEEHRLYFGFRCTSGGDRVATSGNVAIDIKNSNGDLIYSKDVAFCEEDFDSWKSSSWSDSPRYLCCIYIPDSELLQTNCNTGTISFTISIKEGTFDTQTLNISDLPTYLSVLTSYMSLYGQVSPDSAEKKYVCMYQKIEPVEMGNNTISGASYIYYYPESNEYGFFQSVSFCETGKENDDYLTLNMKVDANDLSNGYITFRYYPYRSTLYYSGWADIDLTTVKKEDTIEFDASLNKDVVNTLGSSTFHLGMTSWNKMIESYNLGFDLTDMGVSDYYSK